MLNYSRAREFFSDNQAVQSHPRCTLTKWSTQVAAYELFCHRIKGTLILKHMLFYTNMKYVVSEAFSTQERNASPHLGLICGIQEILFESPSEPGNPAIRNSVL